MPFSYLPVAQQCSILDKLILKTQKALSTRPEGILSVHKRSMNLQYTYRPTTDDMHRIYIRKDNLSFAQALAQKEYEKAFLKAASEQKRHLLKLASEGSVQSASLMYHALAEPYESLSSERKSLVTPYVLPDDQYIQSFLKTPYEKMGFDESEPMILTEKGERVRSKSEKIIADKLDRMGIPYLYEYPLFLRRIGWIHPDFTLLDIRERVTIIMEHFGRMQDPTYALRTLNKLDNYAFDGYIPGDTLLITYESNEHVLDIRTLESLISHRFLE